MEGWMIFLAILSYILVAIAVGMFIAHFFYKKGWIDDWADAQSFGSTCGVFLPAIPFIMLCFGVIKLIGKCFDR